MKTPKSKGRGFRELLSIALVACLLASLLTPLFGSSASAATGSKNDITDRVFSYQAYLMMTSQCVWTNGVGAIRAGEPQGWMAVGSSWGGFGSSYNKNESVGSVFQQYYGITDSNLAQADCDDPGWINKALGLWGFSGDTFLHAIQKAGGLTYSNGAYTTLSDQDHSPERNAIKTVLQNTAFYKGSTLGGLTTDETYDDLMVNLKVQCSGQFMPGQDILNGGDQVTAKTQAVGTGGKLTDGYWHYQDNSAVDVGTALTSSGTMSCAGIANSLSNATLINGYAKYVHDGGTPADTSSTGGGSATSDSKPTCENNGFSLSWIMCPIVNGLASAVQGTYDNLVSPMLKFSGLDPSVAPGKTIFSVWSSFRIFGDILLVVGLLVVVFGQSIGGGVIDAYTAKKVLPRILISAILINLSYYIVAALVDITNVVGGGIMSLISQPFTHTGAFTLNLNGGASGALAAAGVGGTALAVIGGGALLEFLWAFVLLPALLIFLSIVITVVLRQGLLILLVMVSPVAFALYCLPNTEQYFRRWWDLLFRTLLVYPIIAVLFALGNVLSVTINLASTSDPGLLASLTQLVSVVALVIPLLLIPFAFKIAGGILGRAHDTMSNLSKRAHQGMLGNANDPNSWRNRVRSRLGNRAVDRRAALQNYTGTSRVPGVKTLGRLVGGGAGIYARQAVNQQQATQIAQTTGDFGNDAYLRAATIPKSALNDWKDPHNRNHSRYRLKDGQDQYQTADGTWVSAHEVQEGHRYYNTDSSRQFAYKYVLGKAEPGTSQQQDNVLSDYIDYANEAGLDPGTASGRWQGVSIPNKSVRIDQRRAKIEGTRGNLYHQAGPEGVNHLGLLTEYAGMAMPEQYKEAPGSFEAIRDSILHVSQQPDADPNNPAAVREQQELRNAAARAYANLQQYVEGAGGSGSAQVQAMLAQQGLAAEAAEAAGGTGAYASSSSAAAKNRVAAQQALADLNVARTSNASLNRLVDLPPRDISELPAQFRPPQDEQSTPPPGPGAGPGPVIT